MNPIIRHEWRTRWRTFRPMYLLLAFFGPLAAVILIEYYDSHTMRSGVRNTAATGQALFFTLTWMQTLAWIVLAPTLTATTIASERERGLLEALQLSHLKPTQILWGKLGSALAFAALMLIAALPAIAICFLLGGVAPLDFIAAFLLQATTAVFYATIGLTFSALTRRGAIALRATFIAVVGWLVSSVIAFAFAEAFAGTTKTAEAWGIIFLRLVGSTNPIIAAISLDRGPNTLGMRAALNLTNPPLLLSWFDDLSRLSPFWMCIGLQILLIPPLLWWSVRALKRPLDEYSGGRPTSRKSSQARASSPVDGALAASVESSLVPSLWWEIPFVGHWSFANPVLQRETRGKFRMRRVPLWAIVIESLLAVAVAYFYLRAMVWALTDHTSREGIGWALLFIGLLVTMVASIMMGAGSITREREAGTFEGLMLSLVTEGEILAGKIYSSLIACAVFSIPLLPLLALCIRPQSGRGITPGQVFTALCLLASTAWLYTTLGTWLSWKTRRSATAIGWAFGSLFGLNMLLPLLLNLMLRDSMNTLILLTPFGAMVNIAQQEPELGVSPWLCIFIQLGLGAGLYQWLKAALTERARIS
jgi:ABC-type transport system involved in multi-copper enzyme maturation permease subunit